MSPAYDPHTIEKHAQSLWEASDCFTTSEVTSAVCERLARVAVS